MSIVSHELVYSEPNGSRFDVQYRFVDHLGNEYLYNKLVPAGFDTDADMLSMIPEIEAGLERTEVIEAVADGEIDGRIVDRVPDHQSQPDFDRRVIGEAMQIPDLIHFYNIYDTFFRAFEGRAGNNKPQRAAYIGVDTATYDEIDKRFNDMAGITALINDEKGRVWDSLPDGYW
jgi:hypothetical protein